MVAPAVSSSFFQQAVNFTSNSSGTISRYFTYGNRLALYQFFSDTTGTNSANIGKLSTYWTGSHDWYITNILSGASGANSFSVYNYATIQMITNINQSGNYTTGNFISSSSSSYNTTASSLVSSGVTGWVSGIVPYISGSIMNQYPLSTTLDAGAWVLGFMNFTSRSDTTSGQYGTGGTVCPASNLSVVGAPGVTGLSSFKQAGRSTITTGTQWKPYFGYVATTSTEAIATLNQSDIRVFGQTVASVSGPMQNLYWQYFQ